MSGKRVMFLFGCLASTILMAQSAPADDGPITITYRFKAGQFFHYEVIDKAELTTQMASNQAKAVQKTESLKSFRVISVDEAGGAILEPVVEIVRMSSQTGDKAAIAFDSSKDTVAPKGFESLASTIGRPLARFHVTANGRLTKVTMLVTDAPKKLTEAAQKTDPSINFLVVLPEMPVKIGDKWSEKFETQVAINESLNQPLVLIRSYELTSVTDHIATIRVRTSLLTPVTDPTILRQLVQQTPSGTIQFDLSEGRLVSKVLKIDEKIVGAFGQQTLLQADGESTERLVTPNSPNRSASEKVSSGTPKSLPN